jgi:hypothetical protein
MSLIHYFPLILEAQVMRCVYIVYGVKPHIAMILLCMPVVMCGAKHHGKSAQSASSESRE